LKFSGNTSFSSNSALLQGGGIYGHVVSIYFSGNSSFTANSAARGGGEYLVESFNFLFYNTVVTMDSNNAREYGGALYVEDSNHLFYCLSSPVLCFIQVYGPIQPLDSIVNINASLNIHLYFFNNHAGISGNAVYGGSVDNCNVCLEFEYRGYALFSMQL